ncbi:MAG: integrase arm-type DNA-binding domain-containing protein [Alteromonadaceae bacterium]|nr:integrase arm-type DNA-binding domain-containing protein [Alteromonadaceae bacterium]
MGKLTDSQVKSAKPSDKDYKLYDGEGLYILVKANSKKYWRLKYRFGGKEKVLALGVYPKISLAQARQATLKEKAKIIEGIDPSQERKLKKLTANLSNNNTFASIADEFIEKKMQNMSKVHLDRTTRAINRDLKPDIGTRPISEITAPELLAILRKVEERGAIETAHRIKQVAGQIFRYAIATGRAERDISADLKGALASPEKNHFAAIVEPKEVAKLMVAINDYKGTAVVSAALKLSPLLFCRPGELRHLEWKEVNFEEGRIELPAEKMKIKEPLIIPLSKQAISILKALEPLTSNGRYVFPSARGKSRPMSDNAVRTALRTLGYDNNTMTTHGFRAMARTLLDEVLGFRVEYIEQQLGHSVKDHNGRAYNRTKHLNERANMMQVWADYLEKISSDKQE